MTNLMAIWCMTILSSNIFIWLKKILFKVLMPSIIFHRHLWISHERNSYACGRWKWKILSLQSLKTLENKDEKIHIYIFFPITMFALHNIIWNVYMKCRTCSSKKVSEMFSQVEGKLQMGEKWYENFKWVWNSLLHGKFILMR